MKITNVTIDAAANTFYLVFETREDNYSIHLPFSASSMRFRNRIINTVMKLVEQGWEVEDFLRLTEYISYHSISSSIQFFMDSRMIKDKSFYKEHSERLYPNQVIASYEPSDKNQNYRWIYICSKEDLGCLTEYRIHE